jgi:hypothetical protein
MLRRIGTSSKMHIDISTKQEAHQLEVPYQLALQCRVQLSVSVLVHSAHIQSLGSRV